ncbi:LD-carboxypeptidase LdcB/DacB [Streptococcus loxodontisalivarius]|uniref:D-alanyl-D-alanine carboxypeptidase n=1 Tax=Streptococcus loxodontisalivarius TaxID=1349415 RepID=A0ABS2PU31_9STRE|nr:LD-carboxypeptidase LdcB/DacB [Streptococcus loxodontisalivarius]MBM7643436.1 D-alanyl-D-alanine carboxypeptidase [Streptococcus loxodontisalivarius]
MKKLFRTIFCLILLVVLAACSQTKKQSEVASSSSSQEKTSQSSSKVSTTEATSQESSSSESQASSSNTDIEVSDAHYNGSCYYVDGKYGPVIIVNKKHPISSSYAPGDDSQALVAFQELVSAMRAKGFGISDSYSGFRSYETQTNLYNNYVASDGQTNADRYSARPGYSEHQTGLAFDLIDSSGNLLEESDAVAWLADNAHKYGFVVRYLKNKESVTGYMAETWHVRYIGEEATDIYNSGLTLEEYYHVDGGDYQS